MKQKYTDEDVRIANERMLVEYERGLDDCIADIVNSSDPKKRKELGEKLREVNNSAAKARRDYNDWAYNTREIKGYNKGMKRGFIIGSVSVVLGIVLDSVVEGIIKSRKGS